ncbi:dephospho-CoA kinase [Actinotalea sp.]|uniref:dephospho-CoA kinase n=1 Tax=Actinotalea sp. TaxID=1872145 RepID=UPI0035663903
MLRIGLTGGIAAGKSVVSRRLDALGVRVIDHDLLAREVVRPGTEGLAEIVEAFGSQVLAEDGSLDRSALAARVFADQEARARLNGIVHPRVEAASRALEAQAVRDGARVVVHDIPLLVETGQAGHFDEVLVVDAPAALRVERLVHGRGMSQEEAWARLAAQADDEERLAAADRVLDGSGTVEGLADQVDEVVAAWRAAGDEGR